MKVHQIIYVPRTVPPLNAEAIESLVSEEMINRVKSLKHPTQTDVYSWAEKLPPAPHDVFLRNFDPENSV